MSWQTWTASACGLLTVIAGFTMMGVGPLAAILPSGGAGGLFGFILVFGGIFATGMPFLMQRDATPDSE